MKDIYGQRVLLDDGEPSWGLVAVYAVAAAIALAVLGVIWWL